MRVKNINALKLIGRKGELIEFSPWRRGRQRLNVVVKVEATEVVKKFTPETLSEKEETCHD